MLTCEDLHAFRRNGFAVLLIYISYAGCSLGVVNLIWKVWPHLE